MGAVNATDEIEVAFNLAYRIAGSETDAAEAVEKAFLETRRLSRTGDSDAPFGASLFAATHGACHDLMPRRQHPLPAEAPVSAEPSQEAIAGASMRLPLRQREALALRELGQLSYGETAAIMGTSDNAVAQLISRARINLSDELRGTVLASIAAPSPECERALPLIAMREDGQLEAGSTDSTWLDDHLADCERCRLGIEAMREAGVSYRSWIPIAAPPSLLAATRAEAATSAASGRSEQVVGAEVALGPTGAVAAAGSAPRAARGRSPRRRPVLAAGLATLLLLAGVAAILLRDDAAAPPLEPAADAAAAPRTAGGQPGGAKTKAKGDNARKNRKAKAGTSTTPTSAAETTPTSVPVTQVTSESPSSEPAPPPEQPSGEANAEPTQRTATPKPSRQPQPVTTTATTPDPAPAPAPAAAEPAPVEEPTSEPPRRREPPGKPVDRPRSQPPGQDG
ncbi:MAG TPA: sigma-70 family RNA polymerase sigma factor [Solirubrobacterales bacterium]